ncbi:precorrin-8X methylmutase [Desulfovibrio ferrophilus]|uniref:Cobalt-precorrin-8X methylmutase n=1 Tax=Desulfovibrio ferrophilus TaxID=241368 RepID=A0A2Z6AU42_9BACT|nr:precorrin-8X methylmutase [Desulfovibrio ferrophilus]BBD06738.1 cobalt-precorrin-8X methylmutase [Desulfovibrio ferrophilus]
MNEHSKTVPVDIVAPMDIENASMGIIESEIPEPRPFQGIEWQIVRRMIHTSADFEMLDLVRFHPDAVSAGQRALASGCRIFTDTEMARCAIPMRRMKPLGCTVTCLMNDPEVAKQAKRDGTTRALAAVNKSAPDMDGAIVVIGNAPTALLRLLELAAQGKATPALVVGMPVGFVNAAESKALLAAQHTLPYVTIAGRKGGSPLAGCVVNALAESILTERRS